MRSYTKAAEPVVCGCSIVWLFWLRVPALRVCNSGASRDELARHDRTSTTSACLLRHVNGIFNPLMAFA